MNDITHCAEHVYISLHDAIITDILIKNNSVLFEFSEGFTVVRGQSVVLAKSGFIEWTNESMDDVSCFILRRRKTNQGLRFSGRTVSCTKIKQMMKSGHHFEIVSELYGNDSRSIIWKAEILPYARHRLTDCFVVSGSPKTVKFSWIDDFGVEHEKTVQDY